MSRPKVASKFRVRKHHPFEDCEEGGNASSRGRGSDRPFSGQTGRRWLAMSRKSVHLDSSSAGARMSASTFRGRALTLIPAGCKPRIEDMRARSSACLFRPVGRWRRLGVSVDLSLVSLWMQGGH